MNTPDLALIAKALSDTNRIHIIRMLSQGETCACKMLDHFDISQPTLSHHMRILREANLVRARKEGKWMHYSLNTVTLHDFQACLSSIFECTSQKETNS